MSGAARAESRARAEAVPPQIVNARTLFSLRRLSVGLGLRSPPIAVPFAAVIVVLLVACAIFPAGIAPYPAGSLDYNATLTAPDAAHWFGTDAYGRDVLSLVIFGTRSSILMALAAILLGVLAGGVIGLAAGYEGGRLDRVLMQLIDIWLSVPPMLLALIIAAALTGGVYATIIAVASMLMPRFARLIRAQVIALKARPFLAAAHALGAGPVWILRRHILPHLFPHILVLAMLGMAEATLIGASLSFIGLGVVDDKPDWGYLVSQGRDYLTVAWWFATFPGLAITIFSISVNLLGDAFRQRLGAGEGGR